MNTRMHRRTDKHEFIGPPLLRVQQNQIYKIKLGKKVGNIEPFLSRDVFNRCVKYAGTCCKWETKVVVKKRMNYTIMRFVFK